MNLHFLSGILAGSLFVPQRLEWTQGRISSLSLSSRPPVEDNKLTACNRPISINELRMLSRAQRSTMGKKIWKIYESKKFWFRQNLPYGRLPLYVSRGEILHFKHPRVSAVNGMATRRLGLGFSRGYSYISKIKDTTSHHLDKLKIVGRKLLSVLRSLTEKVRPT